jgi:hypothetical protein
MTYISLITPTYLKSFIPSVNKNVDDNLIQHSIDKSQRMKMYDIVGKLYIEDLMNTISLSGETGLSSADQTMMTEYIKPILSLYTYTDMLVPLSYQIDNTGVREKVVAESNLSAKSNIGYLQDNMKNEISWYLEQMNNYLNDNQTLYPLYYQCKWDTPKTKNNAFTGIYFPKKVRTNNHGLDYPCND